MLKSLLLTAALLASACAASPDRGTASPTRLASSTQQHVRALLDRLYRSFNYAKGQEPDWALMRSCFVDGALFVPEPDPGSAVRPADVDAVIAKWQASMRKRSAGNHGYSEWIDHVRTSRVGNLVRADVVFHGKEPGDPQPRKPGLDSLQLVQVDGEWKVLSFVVQYESKL